MSLLAESKFEHETIETFEDGDCIFSEGDTGRDLYIIQQGIVRIMKDTHSGRIQIAEFRRGDFFGDMALLQSLPRTAGAYAKGPTQLLILKPAGFLLKIRRDPTFAFEMMQQMSARVKTANDRLLEILNRYNLPVTEVQQILLSLEEKT